jgi:hypothetical protein
LAIDAEYVYFVDFDSAAVRRVRKDGNGAAQEVSRGPGSVGYGGVAADATHVYWTGNSPPNGGLFRAPIGGGVAEKLAALDNAIDVGLDADYAYVTTQKPGRVLRLPKK